MSRTVSREMNNIEQESSTIFKSLLNDSAQFSSDIKERGRYLEQEITKLEKINKSEKERAEHNARQKYVAAIQGVDESTPAGKKKKLDEFNKYKDETADIEARDLTDRTLFRELKQKKVEFIAEPRTPEKRVEEAHRGAEGKKLIDTLKNLAQTGKTEFSASEIQEAASDRTAAKTFSGAEKQKKAPPPAEFDIDRTESEAHGTFKDISSEAEQLFSTQRERLSYIDKEITKLSQINKQEKERLDLIARQRYEENLRKAGSSEVLKDHAKKLFNTEKDQIQQGAKVDDFHDRVLRTKRAEYNSEADKKKSEIVPVSNVEIDKDKDDDGQDDDRSRGRNIISRGLNRGSNLLRNVGNGVAQGLGFGAVLSLSGFVGKMIDEGLELDKTQARAGAQGLKTGSVSGLKMADEVGYSKGIALSAGFGDVRKLATEQGSIERGTGMDLGSMNSFHTVMRAEGSHGKTLTDSTVEMLSIMKKSDLYNIKKGDFTMTHELLQRQNALNEIQAANLEHISSKSSSQVMAAFGKVGGSFGDHRQAETIAQIDSSIRDPGNDFKNAFIMRSIFSRDSQASLLDVKLAQEEGVFKKGQFQGVMEDLSKTFSGDQLVFSISKMFGLNLEKAKHLDEKFKENPELFKDIGSNEEIEKLVTVQSLAARGGVSAMEVTKSNFDDKFAQWGSGAMKTVREWMDAYEKGGMKGLGTKAFEDIAGLVKKGFEEGSKALKESMDSVAAKLGEKFNWSPKDLPEAQRKEETKKTLSMIDKNLVTGLDSTENEDVRRLKEVIASGKYSSYTPNSRNNGEDIFDDVKDKYPHLFDDYDHKIRSHSKEHGKKKASEFLEVNFPTPKLESMDSLELSLMKKHYVQNAGENSSKTIFDQRDYLENGRTTNALLKEIIQLTEKGVASKSLVRENVNTTTVE